MPLILSEGWVVVDVTAGRVEVEVLVLSMM